MFSSMGWSGRGGAPEETVSYGPRAWPALGKQSLPSQKPFFFFKLKKKCHNVQKTKGE